MTTCLRGGCRVLTLSDGALRSVMLPLNALERDRSTANGLSLTSQINKRMTFPTLRSGFFTSVSNGSAVKPPGGTLMTYVSIE